MKDFHELRERILKGMESLGGVSHIPGEYLSFRIGLYRGQLAAYDALAGAAIKSRIPLARESLSFDPSVLERLLRVASESLALNSPMRADLAKLAEDRAKLEEVINAAVFGLDIGVLKRLAGELGAGEDTLLFFGRACAAPYVSRIVWPAAEVAADVSSGAGECPYCGSLPGLSILRGETGRRFLACSLCGMDWGFPRMKCPFCGAENSLEIMRENDSDPRWIEACSSCSRYLKTADERKLAGRAELIPLLESVSTLYMDFIAEKHGCKRSAPYVALI